MRTELAVGRIADLINDARGFSTLDRVFEVSRPKSGNYTVRRPQQLIDARLTRAVRLIDDSELRPAVRAALADMAIACTGRAAS